MTVDPILGPILVQVGLTLSLVVMLGLVRVIEIRKRGFKAIQTDGFSAKAEQLSDNFKHQFEAPILFYVVALIFAFALKTTDAVLTLAWIYVGLRVLHTVVQLTHDIIFPWRFGLFVASMMATVIMYIIAVMQVVSA